MPRILIIGATGVLGRAAAIRFLEKGWEVRCLVRHPQKAADLAAAGAEVIRRDLADVGSLDGACGQVDVVLTAAHAIMGKGRNSSYRVDDAGHRRLIDAAGENGVRHFIYTSLHGAGPNHPVDFYRTKWAVGTYLMQTGLNYTVLQLPAFMEWHVHRLLGRSIMDKGKTVMFGKGDQPVNFIAVADIVQALNVIAGNNRYFRKVLPLAGPDNWSRNEVIAAYGRALDQRPAVTRLPIGMVSALSRVARVFHPGISRLMQMAVKEPMTETVMDPAHSISQFGLEPTGIETFIQQQLSRRVVSPVTIDPATI